MRTLLLSVEDAVTFLEGRRVRHVQEKRRWIDDYRCVHMRSAGCRCAAGMGVGLGVGSCTSMHLWPASPAA